MKFKKISFFIVIGSIFIAVLMGCGSSTSIKNDNNDTNITMPELGADEGGFSGKIISLFVKELGKGIGGKIGGDVVGDLLNLLGWGDAGDSAQTEMLNNINNKLTLIANEIVDLENEFKNLIIGVISDLDTLKKDGMWPGPKITHIFNSSQTIGGLRGSSIGEADKIAVLAFAKEWLGDSINHGMDDINGIYATFNGSLNSEDGGGILSIYLEQAMLNLGYKEKYLMRSYVGLESLTSRLLGYQIKAMSYTVDSFKVKGVDDNASAVKWFNCFHKTEDENNIPEGCNIMYNEVGNLDNGYSFMYNTLSMVLQDMPLYDPFLHPTATKILKRATFYNRLVRDEKFGLQILYISTKDMPASPDTIYVTSDKIVQHECSSTRHTVQGREYDFWDENNVKPSSDYDVVEYDCGELDNGNYIIYPIKDHFDIAMGVASVNQYDSSYESNSSGEISYGFALLTKSKPNRFTQSSANIKWKTQKGPSQNNQWGTTYGGVNHFPVRAYASTDSNHGNAYYESQASIELQGSFIYDKDALDDQTIHVSYDTTFSILTEAPFVSGSGAGDAYSYYTVGVYNKSDGIYASSECRNKTNYVLHASSKSWPLGMHNASEVCSFVPIPGNEYYVYFKMRTQALAPNYSTKARSNLNNIKRVYIMFGKY